MAEMTETKEKKKLMLENYLGDMTKAYNRKMYRVHEQKVQNSLIAPNEHYKDVSEKTIKEMAIDLIENDLLKSRGSTLQEIGAHLAVHFGEQPSSFTFNFEFTPTGKTEDDKRIQTAKNAEYRERKAEWEKLRRLEVKTFTSIVEDYICTGKEKIKDPLGRIIGIGEDIKVYALDSGAHYRRE